MIPALGGGYAGGNGTDLADSCTDVDAIAATFKKVLTTYNVSRLDLDGYGSGGKTGPAEKFTPADAIATTLWAYFKGIGQLSFWVQARDNGDCPGQHVEGCSGVDQAKWQYTRTMLPFTHR